MAAGDQTRGSRFLSGARQLVTSADTVCVSIAAASVVCIGLLVTANTILRYLFDRPWWFVEEYSGYSIVLITFFGLGYAVRKRVHITIDVVVDRLSPRYRTKLAVVTTTASLAVSIIMVKYALSLAMGSLQHETRASTVMLTPLWIPQLFVVVGLLVFVLDIAFYLVGQIKEARMTSLS
jgi:TRAP-type C4-dicarboxylate transport system permease small subunit